MSPAKVKAENLLDGVIAPLDRAQFLEHFRNKTYVRVQGQPGRFASLFNWDDLNAILEHHRLSPPLFRLVKDHKPLDESRYMTERWGLPFVNSAGMIACLADGATISLEHVDDLTPSLRAFAEACEEVLHVSTAINLYAGWGEEEGFHCHWDDWDVIAVQLGGRKHWKVYQPRPEYFHPALACDTAPPDAGQEPVWEGMLEDGDMLYLPRGWWHMASPVNEPTMHLAVGIRPGNGLDYLEWFIDRLRRHPEVRADVPHFGDAAEETRYVAKLHELLAASWSNDLVPEFLAGQRAKTDPRPHVRLPHAVRQQSESIGMKTRIRLAISEGLAFEKGSGTIVTFRSGENQWQCSPDVVPALSILSGSADHSVEELCQLLPNRGTQTKLKILLTAMALAGALWIE